MRLLTLLLVGCTSDPGPGSTEPDDVVEPIVVVTFNSGTTEGLGHDSGPDDGYTSEHALISDTWYGDGLAWLPAVEAARAFFAEVKPDLVGFQEIFYAGDCATIPAEDHADFYCETWQPGDPTVASYILGDDYQVACHLGKSDKCAAVKKSFGTFRGCDGDFCLEGLDGGEVGDCGSGSRVGRGTVDRADGSVLTFVNFHGSSGVAPDDQACRTAQTDQVFVDLGDGEPGANGDVNIALGDLNTDPGRWASFDPSAARWLDFVGPDEPFQWITELGDDAPPTYQGVATIDHVVSDTHTGSCWHAGFSEGHDPLIDARYFDHVPAVCSLVPR